MPVAAVNGVELYYEERGEGEPLVCITGLGADATGFAPQLPAWARRRRVIAFDARDTGRSSYVGEDYAVADLAADVLGLADHLGLERFGLVGYSLGGAVAQEVLLGAPERVTGVVLVASYAVADAWMRERARLEERRLPGQSDEDMLAETMLVTFGPEVHERPARLRYLRNLILSGPHRQRRDGYVRQLRASLTHDASERLGEVRAPCLVVGAERDLMVPVWHSRRLAALIPGAELVVLDGCGHAVHLERADELASIVDAFLEAAAA